MASDVSNEEPRHAEPRVVRRDRLTLTESCCQALEEAIAAGVYRPGSRLPSEAELAEQLAVSRPTLRDALRMLVERGLILRRQGQGTFVREQRIQKDLNRNFGITDMIKSAGYTPSARDTHVRNAPAEAEVAAGLRVPVGERIWEIARVRLADDRPVVFSTDFIIGDLLAEHDLEEIISGREQSVYSLLYRLCGLTISRGEAQLAPCKTTTRLRTLLEVTSGAPLLCIRQVDFDQRGRPVVYSVEYHVADWVSFSVDRIGPGAAAIDYLQRGGGHVGSTPSLRTASNAMTSDGPVLRARHPDRISAVPRKRS